MGKARPLHSWRKWGKSSQTSKAFGWLFLTVSMLLVRNVFLTSMWLTTITTVMFCNTWGSKSAKNVHSCGGTMTGWSSMTLYQQTVFCRSSYWPLQIWLQSSTLIQLLIWPLLICSCFQEWNHTYNYIIFRMFLKFRNNFWSSYICLLRISYSGVSSVAEILIHCINF